jgi:hypothetical protein
MRMKLQAASSGVQKGIWIYLGIQPEDGEFEAKLKPFKLRPLMSDRRALGYVRV